MQIYNYADYQTTRRSFPVLNLPLRRSGAGRYTTKTPGRVSKTEKTERVLKINRVFSVKSFIIALGAGLTQTENLLKSHLKLALISLLALTAAVSASLGVFKFFSWNASHADPLVLQADPETEISRLDKMMADFAMENYGNINENGDITDAINVSTAFTQPVTYQNYKVQKGDTISGIAKKFGLTNISTLIQVNDIGNVRSLSAGQKLKIPSIDGITYKVKSGETLAAIATKNGISQESILDVNDLESDILQVGQIIFLPGAKMDPKALNQAMGDQFIIPIKAAYRLSSPFGPRVDPVTGKQNSFHKGQDFACPTGTPIYASMGGKIIFSGESWLYGKHVIIDHGNGYQTLYAHMSKIIATKGTHVTQGTRIGLVGNTGYSTGPHLHFTVYKNGSPINPKTVLK